ncbi:hypothetical protein SAMN05443550_11715 [Pedobacter hartonius]|uniref:Uncharacterized protein n=1 Tax=Pedobacter hartonius TaxID=425514 RepID=A0A1H4HFP0_9SPHI|nr:hypothetical protein SAMN05443550_11715 [Pedobacter hartonius]
MGKILISDEIESISSTMPSLQRNHGVLWSGISRQQVFITDDFFGR